MDPDVGILCISHPSHELLRVHIIIPPHHIVVKGPRKYEVDQVFINSFESHCANKVLMW